MIQSCTKWITIVLLTMLSGCNGSYSNMAMQLAFRNDILESQDEAWHSQHGHGSSDEIDKKVKFYLFTRNNSMESLLINDFDGLNKTHFDVKKPTKFVIHGFFGKMNTEMIQNIKDRVLELEAANVVVVDWGQIAREVDYFAVARQTGAVGRRVAALLEFLVRAGTAPARFHLVGHSLGAHVAGFAGKAFTAGRLPRITGLDPAKPYFEHKPPAGRLDAGDADFVDCIHTCGGVLGIFRPLCTADFYPNGGRHAQPGCSLIDFGTCSHVRSHEYFAESVRPEHQFPALACPDGADDPVVCEPTDYLMGYHLDQRARGSFYVFTNDEYPFATIY